jgi:hypothetical protein
MKAPHTKKITDIMFLPVPGNRCQDRELASLPSLPITGQPCDIDLRRSVNLQANLMPNTAIADPEGEIEVEPALVLAAVRWSPTRQNMQISLVPSRY